MAQPQYLAVPNSSAPSLSSSPRSLAPVQHTQVPDPVRRKLYEAPRDPRPQSITTFHAIFSRIKDEFEKVAKMLDLIKVSIDYKVPLTASSLAEVDSQVSRSTSMLRERQGLLPYINNNVDLAESLKTLQLLHEINLFNQHKLSYVKLMNRGEELSSLQAACKEWSQEALRLLAMRDPLEAFQALLSRAGKFIREQHARTLPCEKELFLRIKSGHANQLTLFQYALDILGDALNPIKQACREQIEALRKLENPYANMKAQVALEETFRKLDITSHTTIQGKTIDLENYKHYMFAKGAQPVPPLVKQLQEQTVTALLSLQETVQEHLKRVFQGSTDPLNKEQLAREITLYEKRLHQLELTLSTARSEIMKERPSQESFAALEYLFFIQTLADDLRGQLTFFSSLHAGHFLHVAEVYSKLIGFLTSRTVRIERGDTSHELQEISRLFQVAHAESKTRRFPNPAPQSLELFCNSTLATIETTIAAAGKRAIVETAAEKAIVSLVIAKREIPIGTEGELPHDIKSWLEKGATRFHFFSKGASDPDFDLVLYNIQHVECYRSMYIRSWERDIEFRRIVSSYTHHTTPEKESEQFEIMSDIYMLLEKLEQKIPENEKQKRALLDFSWYVRLRQLLFHIKTEGSTRMMQLRAAASKRTKEYEGHAKLPSYAPDLDRLGPPNDIRAANEQELAAYLYKLIAQALWSRNLGSKQESVQKVAEALQERGKNFIPEDKFTLQLLQEFSLDRFFKQKTLHETQSHCLYQLLMDYTDNPQVSAAFIELFPHELLETICFVHWNDRSADRNGLSSIATQFKEKLLRTRERYIKQWEEFMGKYMNYFDRKVKQATREECQALLSEAQGIAERHRENNAPDEYKKILLSCLKAMERALPPAAT